MHFKCMQKHSFENFYGLLCKCGSKWACSLPHDGLKTHWQPVAQREKQARARKTRRQHVFCQKPTVTLCSSSCVSVRWACAVRFEHLCSSSLCNHCKHCLLEPVYTRSTTGGTHRLKLRGYRAWHRCKRFEEPSVGLQVIFA